MRRGPGQAGRAGEEAFTALVRGAVPGWGGKKGWGPICRRIFAALTDTEGVVVPPAAACCAGAPMSWATCSGPAPERRAVEADMVAVLEELGLSRLADIPA